MSLDRAENVELVDAPKDLVLSKLWKEQYTHLHFLYNTLLTKSMKAVRKPLEELGTVSEDVNEIAEPNSIDMSLTVEKTFGTRLVWRTGLMVSLNA